MYCKSFLAALISRVFYRLFPAALVALLVLFSIGFSTVTQATTSNDISTRSEIHGQLDALGKQKSLTEAGKLTQQDLTHTLECLDAIDRVRQERSHS
ncbi:MAG: hypothetical protein ACR5LD_00400 [Symbiopectobacterium sp.]